MAIFSKKEKKADAPVKAVAQQVSYKDSSAAIIGPRITEKATVSAEAHVYVFNVSRDANKRTIAHAIKEQYNVTPVRVGIVSIKSKTVFRRGKLGQTGSGKKAYVYLKKGDKIEFV